MTAHSSFWLGPAGGATIALVGVLLTTVVTAILGGRSRNWQLEDEHRKLILERGEEAYSLLKRWWLAQVSWYGKCKLVMNQVIDYNKFLDIIIEENQSVDLKAEKIDLIFSIYFPETLEHWNQCVDLIRMAGAIENYFKESYKLNLMTGGHSLSKLSEAMLATNAQVDATLDALCQAMRKRSGNGVVPKPPTSASAHRPRSL